MTPPASSVVAQWTALVGTRIYHTLAAQHMRPSARTKARPEFNGVTWITLPVRRYRGQPIRFKSNGEFYDQPKAKVKQTLGFLRHTI